MAPVGVILLFHCEGKSVIEQFANESKLEIYSNCLSYTFTDSVDFWISKLALSDRKILHEVFDFTKEFPEHYIFIPQKMKYFPLHMTDGSSDCGVYHCRCLIFVFL